MLAGAASASAAELPDEETIYGYSRDFGLHRIDSTGALTFVGGAGGLSAWGIDYNPVDGLAYAFSDDYPCSLYSIDLETGEQVLVGEIRDGEESFGDCDGLDITADGQIWLTAGSFEVLRVSAANAAVLERHTVTGSDLEDEFAFLATDPTTGILYAGNYSSSIFMIDTTTWVATLVAETEHIQSADFDSTGTLWVQGEFDCTGLYSWRPGDEELTEQGEFNDGDELCFDIYAIMVAYDVEPVVPAVPQLAATGAGGQALVGLVSAGGVLMFIGALAVAMTTRRTARS